MHSSGCPATLLKYLAGDQLFLARNIGAARVEAIFLAIFLATFCSEALNVSQFLPTILNALYKACTSTEPYFCLKFINCPCNLEYNLEVRL